MVKQVRPEVTPAPLPDLLAEAAAVVLVVDIASGHVVGANERARDLAGPLDGPAHLREWSRRAGLRDDAGALSAAGRGELVGGGLVHGHSVGNLAQSWWVTAFPVGAGHQRGGAEPAALVTLVEAPHGADHAIDVDPARARLALLADVADAAAELDSPLALQRVAEVLSPRLTPWSVFVVTDGHLRVAAAVGDVDGPTADRFSLSSSAAPPDRGDVVAAQVRGEQRRPVDVSDAGLFPEGTAARWLSDRLQSASPARAMSIPVPGRREVLGLLVVGLPPRGLPIEDVALLTEIARRVGLSMENSRLYAREHQLAETLQRSMLPEQAAVPGLDVWSYYAPNLDHAQVGGDWYDVLQLGPDSVALVVGDVVGHDVEAAASMGQLRSLVRAYAMEEEDPAQVLMRVDQLVRGMRIPRSASMVLARLVRDGDGWELEWSRAGHLPPLLLSGEDVNVLSEGGGTLVGAGDRPRTAGYRRLGPGDVLLLYTDGLIERRSRPLMDGLQLLREVTANLLDSDAAGIGEQLLTALAEEPEDDLAVVVLRVPSGSAVEEAPGAPRQRRWQLPGDPASIGHARRLTVSSCSAWGLSCGPQAELVVSELVANAVLHGWGPVGLRLRHSARGLVVEVDDGNPTPPTAVAAERRGIGGYGIHVVERLAEWGWHRSGPGKTVWARVPETRPLR